MKAIHVWGEVGMMTTIMHDMPRWRVRVRVGRLLRRRLPFLFMSERNWVGADGNNQVVSWF